MKSKCTFIMAWILLGILSSQAAEQMRFSSLVKEGNFFVAPEGNDDLRTVSR